MSNLENQDPQPPKAAEPVAAEPRGWERDVLEKLALFAVKEQRARRRWSIFSRLPVWWYLPL